MITAKQLNGTYPHRQMRMYIENKYPDAHAYTRGAHLTVLVKKFLKNFEDQAGGWDLGDVDVVPRDIDAAFTWEDTPEGQVFWQIINDMQPEQVVPGNNLWVDWGAPAVAVKKAKAAAPKAPLKKQIGWWY